jgi:hypothetical protein
MPRYAEITSAQPGWQFDFAILESEEPSARELRGAQELPDEDVIKALGDAEQLAPTGFLRPALTTAWAGGCVRPARRPGGARRRGRC